VRVILAHAEPRTRERFARVLRAIGHDVTAVGAAEAAVARAREAAPDVVLVDVALCDAQALLAELKGDPDAYRAAVVLVERAGLDLEAAVGALRRGVQDFLVEPVEDAELVARVEAAGRTKVLQEELVVQSRRLEALIFEDPLTGLSNRRFILTQLGAQVSAARRHGRPFSVAMLDIDHFKAVNDEHGHAAGDHVLGEVTHALREHLRAEDQLGAARRRGVPRPASRCGRRRRRRGRREAARRGPGARRRGRGPRAQPHREHRPCDLERRRGSGRAAAPRGRCAI
jgi:two-component system, cell cycle response regulator